MLGGRILIQFYRVIGLADKAFRTNQRGSRVRVERLTIYGIAGHGAAEDYNLDIH